MMRQLSERLPQMIDPWAFARQREILSGDMPVSATHELAALADPDATIHFRLEGSVDREQQSRLKGALEIELNLECQRCLAPLRWPLAETFDYVLIRSAEQESSVEDGSETLICANDELDLAWFLEEEVLLAMPMIAKHEDCVAPDYVVDDEVPEVETENPFAALKNLINNKEQP